jgi:hypothetical protein
VAVVPLQDLKNASYGGPMLLRVPAASLKDLARFGQLLKGKGFPYNTVAVRLGFDHNASYPKLTFKAIRALEPAELGVIVELKAGDSVERILHDAYNGDAAAPTGSTEAQESSVDVEFEQPAAAPAAQPAPAAAPTPPPEMTTAVDNDPVAAAERALAAAKAQAAAKAAEAAKPAKAAKPAAPAPAPAGDSLADDIDSIISDLDGLGG